MMPRQERIAYAERSVTRDPYISRRELQKKLKGRFGVGLRDKWVGDLIRPAKRTATQREIVKRRTVIEVKVAKERRFKPKRQERYNKYRKAGFMPKEALQFSKIRKFITSASVQIMIDQRERLLRRFVARAGREGWGTARRQREWQKTVTNWYTKHGYLTKKDKKGRRRISPWEWFHQVHGNLPPELQDGEYLKHQRGGRKKQAQVSIKKVLRSQWINELKERIAVEPDPKRRAQFREQIRIHQKALRR